MIGETKYEPTTTVPGSTFALPVSEFDRNLAIVAFDSGLPPAPVLPAARPAAAPSA